MRIKVVVQEAEKGGYWAEVPAIPGCATQGETLEELMANVREAIAGCLLVEVDPPETTRTFASRLSKPSSIKTALPTPKK